MDWVRLVGETEIWVWPVVESVLEVWCVLLVGQLWRWVKLLMVRVLYADEVGQSMMQMIGCGQCWWWPALRKEMVGNMLSQG